MTYLHLTSSFPEFFIRKILGESQKKKLDRLRICFANSGDDGWRLKLLLALIIWFAFITPLHAEDVTTKRSTPEVLEQQISGIQAWLVKDESQPLFSAQLIFEGAGSSSDPENLEGLAMFAAALMDEGAGDLDALAFQQAVDEHAIELSFQTDEDALYVNLRSLSENKEEAFRLLGLALTQPRFDKADVERKRAQAQSVLKQAEASPSYQLMKRFRTLAYPEHVYGRETMGTESSLQKISQDDLKDYTKHMLAKSNLIMSVAGELDAFTLKTLIEKNIGRLPAEAVLPALTKTPIQHTGELDIVTQPIPQSLILFATPGVYRDDPRFIAAYVFNHMMGGDSLNSKFGIAIRKEKGLTYSINTSLNPMNYSASWGGMFSTRNEQAGKAVSTLKKVAEDLQKNGFSEADLQKSKDYLTGAFVLALDTNGELVNYLNIMQRFNLGKDYLATRNDQIHAVTLDDVNALGKAWLDVSKWLVVLAGKPEGVQATPAKVAP